MTLRIVVREPERTPLHLLVVEPTEIGRQGSGLLLSDPAVSRRHVRIEPDGDALAIEDLGSTYGTTVDGDRLAGRRRIRAGEVVRLGDTTLELLADAPGSGQSARSTSTDPVVALARERRPGIPVPLERAIVVVVCRVEGAAPRAEVLGRANWSAALVPYTDIIRRQVGRAGGCEVASVGDTFAVEFPTVGSAMDAMCEIQRALHAWARSHPMSVVRLCVGIDAAEAVVDRLDGFDRHLAIAAQMAECARGGEILVSSRVLAMAEPGRRSGFGLARRLTLTGLAASVQAAPLQWSR